MEQQSWHYAHNPQSTRHKKKETKPKYLEFKDGDITGFMLVFVYKIPGVFSRSFQEPEIKFSRSFCYYV